MRSSYSPVLLAAAAFIAASAVSLRAALAQEDKPTEPKAAVPVPSADASDLLRQLDELYKRAIRRPPDVDLSAADLLKVRAEHAKLESEWRRAVEALAKTGDEYLAALGDAAPDARALYFRGVGKLRRAELTSAAESLALFEAAAESFQRYLDGTDAKAAFRADAEMHLGRALMFGRHVDDAIVHLVRAVGLLQEDGRHDEAGEAAAIAMQQLKSLHRDEDLRALTKSIRASDADFGVSTATVRKFAAAARLSVGSPLPDLPAVKDADGKPISWAPGRPLLIHFFLAGFLNGTPSNFREIETGVRPLWEKYAGKGLQFVGVSMDYEIPKAQAEEIRKKWDEWGRKTELADGSIETVRKWTAKQAIEWPWCWDGKATNNPVSLALGGVGVTTPYAVLVDKDGIVRWHGEAPFAGLADEAAKLLP